MALQPGCLASVCEPLTPAKVAGTLIIAGPFTRSSLTSKVAPSIWTFPFLAPHAVDTLMFDSLCALLKELKLLKGRTER